MDKEKLVDENKKQEEKVIKTIPDEKFEKLLAKTGNEHHDLFKKLAQ